MSRFHPPHEGGEMLQRKQRVERLTLGENFARLGGARLVAAEEARPRAGRQTAQVRARHLLRPGGARYPCGLGDWFHRD
ncbi:hypothetical protein [Edaphobacter bradus]|uniref:hypothetical protein n=1 Tax=Edaphobacter bradus TaxID=2259016 RepID=UPI0021DFFC70|nr:hypothetical protein [Edaphobacter bradus]